MPSIGGVYCHSGSRAAGEPAAGHQAMEVGMMEQGLSPGMEHGNEPNLRPQMFRIGRDGAQSFTGSAEQNAIHHLLVLVSHGRDRFGHREHHVETISCAT